jgi:hypothetical protein
MIGAHGPERAKIILPVTALAILRRVFGATSEDQFA